MKTMMVTLSFALIASSVALAQDEYDRKSGPQSQSVWEAAIRGVSG